MKSRPSAKYFLGLFFLSLVMTISQNLAIRADETNLRYGDYEYRILDNGTVEITDYFGGSFADIPAEINGIPVTSIAGGAFCDPEASWPEGPTGKKNQLTSVSIPNTVTNIGDDAFLSNELTSIVIPDSVIKIGAGAFASNHITEVTLPASVISIGDAAFANNNLSRVTIEGSLQYLGFNAMWNSDAGISHGIFNWRIVNIYERDDSNFTGQKASITFNKDIHLAAKNKEDILPIFVPDVRRQDDVFAAFNPTIIWHNESGDLVDLNANFIPAGTYTSNPNGLSSDPAGTLHNNLITFPIDLGEGRYTENVMWGGKLFDDNYNHDGNGYTAFAYDKNLALLSLWLCQGSYGLGDEKESTALVHSRLSDLGFFNIDSKNYAEKLPDGYAEAKKKYEISLLHRPYGILERKNIGEFRKLEEQKIQMNIDRPGVSFASIKLLNGKTLIAVVIRGTTTKSDIATDVESQLLSEGKIGGNGFEPSGANIYELLNKYCSINSIDIKNCRFLITGHSMGGAVAGLITQKLALEDQINLSEIYTYTFASANYKSLSAGSFHSSYANVYNIVNPSDIVPKLPLAYHRIGYRLTLYDTRTYWDYYKEAEFDELAFWQHNLKRYFDLMTKPFAAQKILPVAESDARLNDIISRIRVFCPVDVQVLDTRGNLLAESKGEQAINYDDGELILFTEGDKKFVEYVGDQDYRIIFTGSGFGTMEYAKEELSSASGEVVSELVFNNIPLTPGVRMFSEVLTEVPATNLYLLNEEGKATAEFLEDGTTRPLPEQNFEKLLGMDIWIPTGVSISRDNATSAVEVSNHSAGQTKSGEEVSDSNAMQNSGKTKQSKGSQSFEPRLPRTGEKNETVLWFCLALIFTSSSFVFRKK